MFVRMLRGALTRRGNRHLMIALTVALGACVATSMLSVMFNVGDKVNQELKSYGANIVVRPQGAAVLDDLYSTGETTEARSYLREDELGNIKTIFWTYNILDFAPLLSVSATDASGEHVPTTGTWFSHHLELATGESVETGLDKLRGWWGIEGSWPADDDESGALVGTTYAAAHGLGVGDTFTLTREGITRDFTVRGILTSGDDADRGVYIQLSQAQELLDREDVVGSVEVSALTTPDNDLARKAAKNPNSLSVSEKETWYCTAYVSSIAYQIEEVMTDSVARPVRQVADIDLRRRQRQPVPVTETLDDALPHHRPNPGDDDVQRPQGPGRDVVGPQGLDEDVIAHPGLRARSQHGEQIEGPPAQGRAAPGRRVRQEGQRIRRLHGPILPHRTGPMASMMKGRSRRRPPL